MLDGVPGFLRGAKALFDYRDFLARKDGYAPGVDETVADHWRSVLREKEPLSEQHGLELLQAFGIPVVASRKVVTLDQLREAGRVLGFPLALKTAAPGIRHKTDVGGVILGIEDEAGLERAYAELERRLGAEVVVAQMAPPGVEMLLGARRDPQFGPVVLIGFGGVHAEVLADVMFALPPFGVDHARRCIDRLRLRPLLDGVRGQAAADIDAIAESVVRFSSMVHALRDDISEIDVNPIVVSVSGCSAVDALVVPKTAC